MKLTIERDDLLRSLGHIQSVVEKRNTMPILSNVKLDGRDSLLHINATDMDLHVIEPIRADISVSGSTTVAAHTLYEIVRKLPEGSQVEIEQNEEENAVILRSGRSRFSLATLSVETFPALSSDASSYRFTLATSELNALLDHTKFAIATEETRYYLNGIYLHVATSEGLDVLRAAATDGHRLARFEVPLPSGAENMPGAILPQKTVIELRKLLDESGTDVNIAISETRISFSSGNAVMTSKLIDGTYPEYERAIPTANDQIMKINCQALFEAVDRVSVITSEKSRAIKLNLEEGSLTLSVSNPENGTAREELEASYDGPPIEIGFNSRYLMEVLKQIEGDAVHLAFAATGGPVLIREVSDMSAVYVLMPMRV